MRLITMLLGFSLAACSADIADGHYSCASDSDCPSGLSCQAGRCYRGDASASTVDVGNVDAGPGNDSGSVGDAGSCATCIQVSLTNALSDGTAMVGGLDLDFEGTTITLPSYGQTSELTTVDIGSDGKLTVHQSMLALGGPISASVGMTYRYVVGGPTSMPSVQLLPELSAPDAAQAKVQVVNLLSEPLTIALGSQMVTAPANGVSPTLESMAGGALALTVADANTMQGVFDWSQLPEGNYYVVISGDPLQHLASPQALHAIVVSDTGRAYGSGVVYWIYNGSSAPVVACDGAGNVLSTLTPHTISTAFGAVLGTTPTVHVDTRAACGSAGTSFHEVMVPTTAAGRSLLAVVGDTTAALPARWDVLVMPEPAPGATTTVELANGSAFTVDYENGIDGPTFASSIVPLQQTTYHPPSSMALTVIDVVVYEGGVASAMAQISWEPTAPMQWGVFTGQSISDFDFQFAEIDGPYGMQPMVMRLSSM